MPYNKIQCSTSAMTRAHLIQVLFILIMLLFNAQAFADDANFSITIPFSSVTPSMMEGYDSTTSHNKIVRTNTDGNWWLIPFNTDFNTDFDTRFDTTHRYVSSYNANSNVPDIISTSTTDKFRDGEAFLVSTAGSQALLLTGSTTATTVSLI